MNSSTIKKYQDISELNVEAYMFMNTIGKSWSTWEHSLIKNNRILLSLQVNDERSSETNEWVGIVSTMKIFIRKHLAVTNENIIKNINNKIEHRMGDMKTEMGEMKKQMGTMESNMSVMMKLLKDIHEKQQ